MAQSLVLLSCPPGQEGDIWDVPGRSKDRHGRWLYQVKFIGQSQEDQWVFWHELNMHAQAWFKHVHPNVKDR